MSNIKYQSFLVIQCWHFCATSYGNKLGMGTIWINGNNNYIEVIFKFKPYRNANITNVVYYGKTLSSLQF